MACPLNGRIPRQRWSYKVKKRHVSLEVNRIDQSGYLHTNYPTPMEARKLHRTHRCFDPQHNRMACLHPILRTLLVQRFQPVSEPHRDDSLVSYHWSADRLDVGGLGNQTL